MQSAIADHGNHIHSYLYLDWDNMKIERKEKEKKRGKVWESMRK